MIISFADSETQKVWEGEFSIKLPPDIQQVARRKLRMLNNAFQLSDLSVPPANRLEKLAGEWKRFYSIRINEKWRVVFEWHSGQASNVRIIDYHK